MKNPYEVLGVSPLDDMCVIKKRFRKLAKEYHPDLNNGDSYKCAKFKELMTAYKFIEENSKLKKKQQYWSHKSLFTIIKRSV